MHRSCAATRAGIFLGSEGGPIDVVSAPAAFKPNTIGTIEVVQPRTRRTKHGHCGIANNRTVQVLVADQDEVSIKRTNIRTGRARYLGNREVMKRYPMARRRIELAEFLFEACEQGDSSIANCGR